MSHDTGPHAWGPWMVSGTLKGDVKFYMRRCTGCGKFDFANNPPIPESPKQSGVRIVPLRGGAEDMTKLLRQMEKSDREFNEAKRKAAADYRAGNMWLALVMALSVGYIGLLFNGIFNN